MKKVLPILLLQFCCYQILAQTNIFGVYSDNNGRRLEITNNKFSFTSNPDNGTGYRYYLEAEYVWANDHFISLIQQTPLDMVNSTLEIIQTYDSLIYDNEIRIKLSLPNASENLRSPANNDFGVLCFENDEQSFSGDYVLENDCNEYVIYVPRNTDMIRVIFNPQEISPIQPDCLDGYYNGYTGYMSRYIYIDANANNVEIISHNLDDGYFSRYYVNGDYVRVEGDRLYWRGRVFEKSYDPEDIRYIEEKESALKK